MENFPDITVLVITYDRWPILEETLRSYFANLTYAGRIKYLISHDGLAYYESERFTELLDRVDPNSAKHVTMTGPEERGGLGANCNYGLGHTDTEIVLQTQDDYKLLKPLDLTPHVQKLYEDDRAGWIKFRCIAGHRITATIAGNYWCVDWPNSPELYIVSDQPHLKRKDFHSTGKFGLYPEGLNVAETENTWCNNANEWATVFSKAAGATIYDVLIPIGFDTENSWAHIANGPELSWKDRGL